jgi:hypothetical protein
MESSYRGLVSSFKKVFKTCPAAPQSSVLLAASQRIGKENQHRFYGDPRHNPGSGVPKDPGAIFDLSRATLADAFGNQPCRQR